MKNSRTAKILMKCALLLMAVLGVHQNAQATSSQCSHFLSLEKYAELYSGDTAGLASFLRSAPLVTQEEIDGDWKVYRAVEGMRFARLALAQLRPLVEMPASGMSFEGVQSTGISSTPSNVDRIVVVIPSEQLVEFSADAEKHQFWVQTKILFETTTKDFVFDNVSGEILQGPPGIWGHASRIVRLRIQIQTPIPEDQPAFKQSMAPILKSKMEALRGMIMARFGRDVFSNISITEAGLVEAEFVSDAPSEALAIAVASLIH